MSRKPHITDEEAAERAIDWAVHSGSAIEVAVATAGVIRQRRRHRIGAALGGLAALLALGLFWHSRSLFTGGSIAAQTRAIPSFLSLARTTTLPDGSIVQFRDDSQIAVNFTAALRRVTLISGEVHFQVTHNNARPFIVSAGGVEARAVGTAFSVQLSSSTVDVLVTEGRVAVDEALPAASEAIPSPTPATSVLVAAGNRVVVSRNPSAPSPAVEPVSAPAMAESLAWRIPLLHLSGTPLSEVIPILDRYAHTRLVLADPSLSALQLSGSLRADNLTSFLGILKLQFGVEAQIRGEEIILHR